MTSDYDGFIRAICENPADDLVRLVFADWLQDNGEEDRAERIRLSIRSTELLRDGLPLTEMAFIYRREWFDPIPDIVQLIVTRMFVVEIRLPLADFLAHAKDLFSAHPIERVTLTDQMPYGSGIRRGWFHPSVPDAPGDTKGHDLPEELFKRLTGHNYHIGNDGFARWYYDDKVNDAVVNANDALSRMLVTFGRESASLPPLPLATPPMKEPDAQA